MGRRFSELWLTPAETLAAEGAPDWQVGYLGCFIHEVEAFMQLRQAGQSSNRGAMMATLHIKAGPGPN